MIVACALSTKLLVKVAARSILALRRRGSTVDRTRYAIFAPSRLKLFLGENMSLVPRSEARNMLRSGFDQSAGRMSAISSTDARSIHLSVRTIARANAWMVLGFSRTKLDRV